MPCVFSTIKGVDIPRVL